MILSLTVTTDEEYARYMRTWRPAIKVRPQASAQIGLEVKKLSWDIAERRIFQKPQRPDFKRWARMTKAQRALMEV